MRASATAPPSIDDFGVAVSELIALFAEHGKSVDAAFAARVLTENAQDGATFVDTFRLAQEVLERVPRAKPSTVLDYIAEGIPGLLRMRATLSVGRNTYEERHPTPEPVGREMALAQIQRVKSALEAR